MSAVTTDEARIAALLSSIPIYERWLNQSLDVRARAWLRNANEQQLMTLAAEALLRLADADNGQAHGA